MARPVTIDYNQIKNEIEEKGVVVTDINRDKRNLIIYFNCTNCGEPYSIRHQNYLKGDNPKFLCKRCQALKGPKMQRIQEYFDSMDVPIESVDFFDETGHSLKHWVVHFNCSRCGNPYNILDDYVGKNNKELCCPNCRDNNKVYTQASVSEMFAFAGSELLSEYKGYHVPVKFRCSICGGTGEIDLAHYKNGVNTGLLCRNCLDKRNLKPELLKILKSKGSELLGEYKSAEQPLLVRCTKCKEPFMFHFGRYRWNGANKDIMCLACRRKESGVNNNLADSSNSSGRRPMDSYWYIYVKEFFSLPGEVESKYEAHHIVRYINDEDLCTSITNGYPLLYELHTHQHKYYHVDGEPGVDIENWTGKEKLPYHNYSGFKFLNINEVFVSEFIYPSGSMLDTELYERKKYFAAKGKFYLPLFLHELKENYKRQKIYSYMRRLLYAKFPTIYSYTGVMLQSYNATDLSCEVLSWNDVSFFFGRCHFIPTYMKSEDVYIVLKNENNIVASMVFTRPWQYKYNYEWELLVYVEELNTVVTGGFERLFEFFNLTYKPQSVVFNSDVRFVNIDPQKYIIMNLGFKFNSYIRPDFEYRCPDNTVISRRAAKSIVEHLTTYDDTLTQEENLEKAGYVKLYGCGEYRYIWIKK